MTDFFLSYTRADRDWAVWIAWVLEAAGFITKNQAWDFGAGSNFIVEMHKASAEAERTIAVLSPEYLGYLAAARPYYERALAIWEARLGPDHPNTKIARENLAALGRLESDEQN
jgi:hypothetical protein